MSPNKGAAVTLHKKSQGLMVVLDKALMGAVDDIHPCMPFPHCELDYVSNGCDNIRFASPGYGLTEWGSFDKKRKLMPFIIKSNLLSSIIG